MFSRNAYFDESKQRCLSRIYRRAFFNRMPLASGSVLALLAIHFKCYPRLYRDERLDTTFRSVLGDVMVTFLADFISANRVAA